MIDQPLVGIKTHYTDTKELAFSLRDIYRAELTARYRYDLLDWRIEDEATLPVDVVADIARREHDPEEYFVSL